MRILYSALVTLLAIGIHEGRYVRNCDKNTHIDLLSKNPVPNGGLQILTGTWRTPFVNRPMDEKNLVDISLTPGDDCSAGGGNAGNEDLDPGVSEELIINDLGASEELIIEYVSRRGKFDIMSDGSNLKINRFVHRHGLVTEIPSQLCDFTNIVKIDLSYNFVKFIENIECLPNLSTLILKFNNISEIKNTTFSNSKNLRILNLSFNQIKSLEPNSLIHLNPNGCFYDFSFNSLTEVDISNVLMARHFRNLSYRNNNITDIVNQQKFSLKVYTKQQHGGHINLSETKISTINFHKLGVSKILDLEKGGYSFSFEGNEWLCDCYMQSLLVVGDRHLSQIWPNYRNALCKNFNRTIAEMQLYNYDYLGAFTCCLRSTDKCPSECSCQQDSQKVVVNCSSRQLTEMPKYMPVVTCHLYIDLSYNKISRLMDTPYLHCVKVLNLSYNSLSYINNSARCKLSEKEARVITEGSPINTFNKCGRRRSENDQESSPLWEYLHFMLGFLALIAFFFFIVASTVRYKHELYCLRKHLHRPRTHKGEFKYDSYISMNENNIPLLSWTKEILVRRLKRSGYAVYFRPTDERLGCVKEEEIIDAMSNSRVYIILLSDDYLLGSEEPWSSIEWRHAWNKFKQESNKHNIIIINYDFKRPREFPKGTLKAMLNLEIALDFSNQDRRLHQNICTRIGTPNRNYWALRIGFRNMNTKFNARLISENKYIRQDKCEGAGKKKKIRDSGSHLILPAIQLKTRKQRFVVKKIEEITFVLNNSLEC